LPILKEEEEEEERGSDQAPYEMAIIPD